MEESKRRKRSSQEGSRSESSKIQTRVIKDRQKYKIMDIGSVETIGKRETRNRKIEKEKKHC
jgi:hypothetical protein